MEFTVQGVIENLNKLLNVLEPVHSLANSHFASFLSEDLWNREAPPAIHAELNNSESINNFIELYPEIIRNNCPNDFASEHPELLNFIRSAVEISVINDNKYSRTLLQVHNLFISKGYLEDCDFKMETFMSQKKLHEVRILSKLTAMLSGLTKSSHIVDVGGGKGYLSSVLALHHCYKVLGLDSCEMKTCGASKMSANFAQLWGDDIPIKTGEQVSNKKAKEEFIRRYYKQVTTFVRSETDVGKLLKESFKEEVEGVTLTGLHTCGDLAPTCLQMFVSNEIIKGLVNVGCCYHLLSEEFTSAGSTDNLENHGFPMSSYLKEKRFALGRNALMLAGYSLNFVNSSAKFESALTSLFYRAILDVVIKSKGRTRGEDRVRKLAKKCQNYQEYMKRALKKFDIEMSEDEVNRLQEAFETQKPIFTAFFLLRVTLSPVIESIILLDRILYLIENGVSNAYLVSVFDLEISPRGFGIVAWKDNDT